MGVSGMGVTGMGVTGIACGESGIGSVRAATAGMLVRAVTGVRVLLGAVLLAVAVGVVTRVRDGRFRPARRRRHAIDPAAPTSRESDMDAAARPDAAGTDGELRAGLAALGAAMGERATLLQFSTAFCAPCRTTRRVLAGVAEVVPGVRHVEVDAEAHLGLVRRLGVRRTPTVLIIDARGHEIRRASGAPPTRDAVFATLAEIMRISGINRADGDSSESSSMV
jgi:hypothetical protein